MGTQGGPPGALATKSSAFGSSLLPSSKVTATSTMKATENDVIYDASIYIILFIDGLAVMVSLTPS
jgi:hypothetical protein